MDGHNASRVDPSELSRLERYWYGPLTSLISRQPLGYHAPVRDPWRSTFWAPSPTSQTATPARCVGRKFSEPYSRTSDGWRETVTNRPDCDLGSRS
jgi:hypothetical protein